MMPRALFEEIITKIAMEAPVERIAVSLENWGEPLLHPDLPAFIEIAKRAEFYVSVSTNLSTRRDLTDIVKACPSSLRTSLSGFYPETYARTHTGGDVDLVKSNLHRLRDLAQRVADRSAQMHICYHWYRHNTGRDLRDLEQFADNLGYPVVHKIARMYPLERLLDCIDANRTPTDDALHDLLAISPEEWRDAVRSRPEMRDAECLINTHEAAINHDGSVALCSITFAEDNIISRQFLDVTLDELQKRRANHPTCMACHKHGVHQSHGMDDDLQIQQMLSERMMPSRGKE